MSPKLTPQKMLNVPMLTSWASMLMSNSTASAPVTAPLNIDAFAGVPCFSLTRENHFGSKPSRAITMKMRGCPIIESNSDVVMAATAPMDTMVAIAGIPYAVNAIANGALTSMSSYETMPVITTHIAQYNAAQIPSDPKIPNGKSAAGLATSSAHVATVSKPTKAKITTDAPDIIPRIPYGANGVQFDG